MPMLDCLFVCFPALVPMLDIATTIAHTSHGWSWIKLEMLENGWIWTWKNEGAWTWSLLCCHLWLIYQPLASLDQRPRNQRSKCQHLSMPPHCCARAVWQGDPEIVWKGYPATPNCIDWSEYYLLVLSWYYVLFSHQHKRDKRIILHVYLAANQLRQLWWGLR